LVPFGDVDAFEDRALQLLDDPALWQQQSDAARNWAATFNWDTCIKESLAIFAEVSSRQPSITTDPGRR